jgi:hypothetical protein
VHGLAIRGRRRVDLIVVDGFFIFGNLEAVLFHQCTAFQTADHRYYDLDARPSEDEYGQDQTDDDSQC